MARCSVRYFSIFRQTGILNSNFCQRPREATMDLASHPLCDWSFDPVNGSSGICSLTVLSRCAASALGFGTPPVTSASARSTPAYPAMHQSHQQPQTIWNCAITDL